MKLPEVCTGALILNKKDKILLIKSSKWNDKYIIPGGHVKYKESLRDAVKREVREETNLDIKIIDLIECNEYILPEEFEREAHFIFISYLCRAKNKKIILDKREGQEYIWISPEKAILMKNINFSSKRLIQDYLKNKYLKKFKKLFEIEKLLRKKCPWDAEQTLDSMKNQILEETKELIQAIDNKDSENIIEEMGDLFVTLLLMIIIADDSDLTDLSEVIGKVTQKMIRRHTHVFGKEKNPNTTVKEALDEWKRIKKEENKQ
ncbi:NUDIX domain-containing protein [Candidatus Woesearchaeota archaeon]|nr:NUDIX domain-containing protein [Candidatus Woesearchaeota archaeon]